MKFDRHTKLEYGLGPLDIAPFLNVIFLLFMFFLLSSPFVVQPSIDVNLPKAVTSDAIKEENLIITVTSEDVIYLNGKVVIMKELLANLKTTTTKNQSILIKADRRSSMGRIVDVWDLCRNLGIEKINIATNQEN